MLINEQTKIAALLKHHPDALEAIVALSPDFKKLRNPVLRALMAKRTSIAMASKIGGCTPEDFFRVLAPLGFETDPSGNPVKEMVLRQKAQFRTNRSPDTCNTSNRKNWSVLMSGPCWRTGMIR